MNDKLLKFEEELMIMLLAGEDSVLSMLREQFESVNFFARELTGVGFYLHFNMPKEIARISDVLPSVKSNFCFGDVDATIEGLNNGAGFLIWIRNGYLTQLEGYTYGEKWPSQITDYKFYYRRGRRNIEGLHNKWVVSKK
ncbi:MAG: hypothetical protein QM730_18825 [Anaerolineales bacterium]